MVTDMTLTQVSDVLAWIVALRAEKEAAEKAVKEINSQLDAMNKQAVELFGLAGVDGINAHGKSWYLREWYSVSVPVENRDAVMAAAREAGLDDMIGVNTTSLKSYLMEQRSEGEGAGDDSLAAGTPFAGLVREYREVRLSHTSAG